MTIINHGFNFLIKNNYNMEVLFYFLVKPSSLFLTNENAFLLGNKNQK
jgi:hypothetical protein